MIAKISVIQAVLWTLKLSALLCARRTGRKHASFLATESVDAQLTIVNPVDTLIEGRKSAICMGDLVVLLETKQVLWWRKRSKLSLCPLSRVVANILQAA